MGGTKSGILIMHKKETLKPVGTIEKVSARLSLPLEERALRRRLSGLRKAEKQIERLKREAVENKKAAGLRREMRVGTLAGVFDIKPLPEGDRNLPADNKRLAKAQNRIADALEDVMTALAAVNYDRWRLGLKEAEVRDFRELTSYNEKSDLEQEWDEYIHESGNTLFKHLTPEEEEAINRTAKHAAAQEAENERNIDMTEKVQDIFFKKTKYSEKRAELETRIGEIVRNTPRGTAPDQSAMRQAETIISEYMDTDGRWRSMMDALVYASGNGTRFAGEINYRFSQTVSAIAPLILQIAKAKLVKEIGTDKSQQIEDTLNKCSANGTGYISTCIDILGHDRLTLRYLDIATHERQYMECVLKDGSPIYAERTLNDEWQQAGYVMGTLQKQKTNTER